MSHFSADISPKTGFSTALHRADIRNLLFIALGFALIVLLLPPTREYPISDECVYVPALRSFSATLIYSTPDYAQTSLVGLIWLGWLWTQGFGFSFTSLSLLTLAISLATLIGFYLLLRELDIGPGAGLLGTALLGFNPIYLHLSYVYMTEVPFLGLLFFACLCYLRGLRGRGEAWLWLGGGLVAYDFLIRQYALFIPIALLLYMLIKGWSWRRAVAATLPFAIVAAIFLYWQQGQPLNIATRIQLQASAFLFTTTWPRVFLTRVFAYIPLLGLFVWPPPRLRRPLLTALWLALAAMGVVSYIFQGGAGDSLFRNSLDYDGNILTRAGFGLFLYHPSSVLSGSTWDGIMLLGVALGVALLATISDRLLCWWQRRATWQGLGDATLFVYIIGLLIAFTTYAFSGLSFDRYTLAFVPTLLIFLLRESSAWQRWVWGYMIVATLLLGGFSLLLQADYADRAAVRWQAGQLLVAQGVKPADIWVGSEWLTWYNASADEQRPYIVSEQNPAGYTLVRQLPYYTRLGGFTTRDVNVWMRDGLLPLLPVGLAYLLHLVDVFQAVTDHVSHRIAHLLLLPLAVGVVTIAGHVIEFAVVWIEADHLGDA